MKARITRPGAGSHGGMNAYIQGGCRDLGAERGIVEIQIDGPTDSESYRALIQELDAQIAARGQIKVLEIICDLGWVSPAVWWEDLGWSFRHLRDISRAAVVTDKSWIGPIVKMMSGVMTGAAAQEGGAPAERERALNNRQSGE